VGAMDEKKLLFNNKQDKRLQILAAAAKIFTAKGFHPTKVEEIATAAGVGKGTVYEYFSSKTEVFREMLSYLLEFYKQYFEERLDRSKSVREQLFTIMSTHAHFLKNNKDLFSLILEPHQPIDEETQAWLVAERREILDGLAQIIQTGIERGELKPVNTFVAAQILLGTMISFSGEVFLAKKDWDYQEIINHILEILFQGLEC
jgi:AcrR family transcriptional regulator